LKDLGVNGKIILEWLEASEVDWSVAEWGQVVGSCESGNEPAGNPWADEKHLKRTITHGVS